MGNDMSSKNMQYNQQQIQEYARKYNEMEVTISTHNLTIQNLLAEKQRLSDTVKRLEDSMTRKDEDMKKRVSDIKSHQKKVHTELSKYKSIPEFEDILSLYTELLEFRNKIDSSLSSNDVFKVSKDEEEISKLKKSNMELSKQLISIGGKSVLHEKAAELQAAESEVNVKKDLMRQEFLKNNGRLVKIQEKMKECTSKFAGTMSNAILETKNQLQKHKKEFSEVDCVTSKLDDNIPYAKVMNILLQQQNTLMKEIILTTGGAGPSNPGPQKILNNLRPTPNQPVNTNIKPLMSFSVPTPQVEDNQYDSDDDDAYSRIFDDDISETGSVSEIPKPFKLIMHNIPDCGNDRLFVIEVLKKLTDLPLDDIVVRRIGKSGSSRPILVCFEKIKYVHQILKMKHKIQDGPFSNVRINTYNVNKEGTSKGRPNNNAKSDGKNRPNQQGQQKKPQQNRNVQKKPNNPNNQAKNNQGKQNNTKDLFPF